MLSTCEHRLIGGRIGMSYGHFLTYLRSIHYCGPGEPRLQSRCYGCESHILGSFGGVRPIAARIVPAIISIKVRSYYFQNHSTIAMTLTVQEEVANKKSMAKTYVYTVVFEGLCCHTFGKALACAAMIVMSPSCGVGLLSGVYCLTARYNASFS